MSKPLRAKKLLGLVFRVSGHLLTQGSHDEGLQSLLLLPLTGNSRAVPISCDAKWTLLIPGTFLLPRSALLGGSRRQRGRPGLRTPGGRRDSAGSWRNSRKEACAERGGEGQPRAGDSTCFLDQEAHLLDGHKLWPPRPSEGPPSRQLRALTLPSKAFSSQAAAQPPTLALVPHPC